VAIYHCSTKPLGRSGGRSAVAAAAYRSAERLENARDIHRTIMRRYAVDVPRPSVTPIEGADPVVAAPGVGDRA